MWQRVITLLADWNAGIGLGFRVYSLSQMKNKTYSGDESGEAETVLFSVQSGKEINFTLKISLYKDFQISYSKLGKTPCNSIGLLSSYS